MLPVKRIPDPLTAELSDINVQKIGEVFNQLYDFGYDKDKGLGDIDYEVENILYPSAARHIAYIFKAFKGLESLPKDIKKGMTEVFCDNILQVPVYDKEMEKWTSKGQGWSEFIKDPINLKQKVSSVLYDKYHLDYRDENNHSTGDDKTCQRRR